MVNGPTRGKYVTIVGKKNKTYRDMVKLINKNKKEYPKRNAEQVSREIRNTTSNEGEGQFFGSAQK